MSVRSRALRLRIFRVRENCRPWSASELKRLRALYPHRRTDEVAKLLGHSYSSTSQKARKLGLRKTEEYMASREACWLRRDNSAGIPFRFKKGLTPWNKGLRRPGWAPGRMAETQFKKGHQPCNTYPVGAIVMNTDGYLRRKIAEDRPGHGATSQNWELVHRRVWEDAHGPIPKGSRIWWKDGDHTNCALENLELLNGKQHMARTTIHTLPPELAYTIQLLGAVHRQINQRINGEKQTLRSARPPVRDAGSAEGSRQTA
jgi:hypothetical protein